MSVGTVSTAWDLIGFDGSGGVSVRVVGGYALYEAVTYNDATRGLNVRLDRVKRGRRGLRVVNRYVDPDTLLEIVSDE